MKPTRSQPWLSRLRDAGSRERRDRRRTRPWWRLRDTPVPGGVPELARALLWAELAIVLLVSLGRSAVYSVVSLVSALTAPGALSAQAANLNNSLAPDRPWLDLTYQLLRIGFALVPVALAAYFLVRSGTRLREVWARDGGWAGSATSAAAHCSRSASARSASCSTSRPTPSAPTSRSSPSRCRGSGGRCRCSCSRPPRTPCSRSSGARLRAGAAAPARLRRLRGDRARALLRGSYHLYQGLGGFVGNLAMGLLFGYLFRRWGRVMPFVVAHTLLDVGAFVGYAVLAGRVDWLPTL